jgi:hypothetical protein
MTRRIGTFILGLFLVLQFPGCSGPVRKYGMDSWAPFKVTKNGHYVVPASMDGSFSYSPIRFEGVAKVSGIKVDPRIFRDSAFLSQARDVEAYLGAGEDSALLFYRNYVTSCCDGYSVGSFLVFLGLENGKVAPSRSFITESGSIEPPHYTWWPRKVIERDSSIYIEAFQSQSDTLRPYWFEVFHSGATTTNLGEFSESKRKLRRLIHENEKLIKN